MNNLLHLLASMRAANLVGALLAPSITAQLTRLPLAPSAVNILMAARTSGPRRTERAQPIPAVIFLGRLR